ncbi:ATP-binding protein [Spirillospora sp. NBC_00431]
MQLALVLCLPRDAETVQLTRGVLDASLKVLGVTAETRDDITLALGEACANVVQHADPADEYEMRVGVHDSRCRIEVIDAGRGFDAAMLEKVRADATLTAEHGRGLQIIDALAENLQIANGPQHGAMVRFEKPLAWEPGSAGQHFVVDD